MIRKTETKLMTIETPLLMRRQAFTGTAAALEGALMVPRAVLDPSQDHMEPTVADANVVLGYLPAEQKLGGDMRLDRVASTTS